MSKLNRLAVAESVEKRASSKPGSGLARQPPTVRRGLGYAWVLSALLLGVFWAADALIYHDSWATMYPLGDEFSLITHSAHLSADWFLSGYSRYFIVYPQWTHAPHFNFARPVANLIYRLFEPFSQARYQSQLLVVNYGVHCLIAVALFLTSLLLLRSSPVTAAAIALAGYLAPPFFDSPMPVSPCYAFDGVAALLCLLAAVLVAVRRDLPALLGLLLALLTKEAAIPMVGAVLAFAVVNRRSSLTAGCLALTVGWIALRLLAFGQLGGTYSSDGLSLVSLLIRCATITHVPLGHVDNVRLRAVAAGKVFNESALFLVLNLAIGLVLARLLLGSRPWRRIARPSDIAGRHDDDRVGSLSQLSLLAAAFSLVFFVVIAGSGEIRYAYVFFVMFLLLVASLPASSGRACLLGLLLLGAAAGAVGAIAEHRAAQGLWVARYAASRQLVAALQALPPQRQPVSVLNDFVGEFSAEHDIAAFAGYPGQLIRVSSIDPGSCTVASLRKISTDIRQAGGYQVTVAVPPCARFVFEGTDSSLSSAIRGDILYRDRSIQYVFPHLLRAKSSLTGRSGVQFGDIVKITMKTPGRLLYFDFARGRWAVR